MNEQIRQYCARCGNPCEATPGEDGKVQYLCPNGHGIQLIVDAPDKPKEPVEPMAPMEPVAPEEPLELVEPKPKPVKHAEPVKHAKKPEPPQKYKKRR